MTLRKHLMFPVLVLSQGSCGEVKVHSLPEARPDGVGAARLPWTAVQAVHCLTQEAPFT